MKTEVMTLFFSQVPNFAAFVSEQAIVGTVSPLFNVSVKRMTTRLSYSHLELLADLDDDDFKRRFYEVECIRGKWSVRELKRQIASLYYERSGLSTDKNKLAIHVESQSEQLPTTLNVRDPYEFEFLADKLKEAGGGND
jgi:hypothetical protein